MRKNPRNHLFVHRYAREIHTRNQSASGCVQKAQLLDSQSIAHGPRQNLKGVVDVALGVIAGCQSGSALVSVLRFVSYSEPSPIPHWTPALREADHQIFAKYGVAGGVIEFFGKERHGLQVIKRI